MRKEYFSLPQTFLDFDQATKLTLAAEYTIGEEAVDNPWHIPILRSQFGLANIGNYVNELRDCVEELLDQTPLKALNDINDSVVIKSLDVS